MNLIVIKIKVQIGDWGAEWELLNWGRNYFIKCVVEFSVSVEMLSNSDQTVSQFAHCRHWTGNNTIFN